MEALSVIVIGAIITGVTQLIQKKYTVSARVVLWIMSVLLAIMYNVFVTFVPEALQATTVEFVSSCMWSAVFVYEYFVRIWLRKDLPSFDIKEK